MSDSVTPAGEFPAKGNSGCGSARAYRVQVRYVNNGDSCVINGIALGPKWVTLEFPEAPIGVPKGEIHSMIRREWCHSLLSYPSAQALRWWFIANAAVEGLGMGLGHLCMETRLVRYEQTFSYAETAMAAEEPTDGKGRPVVESTPEQGGEVAR